MQRIDPADPRRPNVQIAASIRAAILSGELAPGERLPGQRELARYFDAATLTVGRAIRTLTEEGYVTTTPGGGVWVRDQAALPAEGEADELAGLAAYLYEAGQLKRLPRAGWQLLGLRLPETVAEHSFRVGLLGVIVATMEGADAGHTAALGLVHDMPETRIGDVPSVGRAYVTTAAPEAVTAQQTAGLPPELGKVLSALVAEYEAAQTPESRCAHDADKLETLLQATEYAAQGHRTQAWADTSTEALRTAAGHQLARAITATPPSAWWSGFAASYHELRADSQQRRPRQDRTDT